MKNINLQQIYYFRITMKCSSFSQAAEIAYTTQSTISKNISSLEKIIGEPLFIRQKKGILPTQKAIILNLELSEIYDKLDLLFSHSSRPKRDSLSICFCQNIDFPSTIPEFFSLFTENEVLSKADIRLYCRENEEAVNAVIDGAIDLGFILSDTNVSNPTVKLHTIVSAEPQIFYSVNCPLNKKEEVTLNDFTNYTIVTTKYLIEKNDYRMINLLPFAPKGVEVVESYDDILIYLATGRYITVMRPFVYLANDKNIRSYKLPASYNLSQGITMIWFGNNRNRYLKKVLSLMTADSDQ